MQLHLRSWRILALHETQFCATSRDFLHGKAGNRRAMASAQSSDEERQACLALLGLEAGASRSEVRAKYLSLAKEWHPDIRQQLSSTEDSNDPAAKFRRLKRCFELLSTSDDAEIPQWLRDLRNSYATSKDPFP
mmetsp:Transcript_145316/g.267998  ORF Transcript_145316/g.267998 Transcript_145316/m.267998 type:complete len:134 (+) Transcript_145316:59-460(+)